MIARKARAGQFVVLMIDEKGERIPLTVADWDREKGILTIVFAVACVGLGIWQFERRAETVARIELIQRNYDSTPVSLAQAVAALGSAGSTITFP